MTINSPAAPIWAMYIVAAEKAGVPRARARGHDPERHPQGVRRPEGVPVPARAVDAPRRRHDRVRDARDAALEHGLDQRLPHPRGGLDRGPGAGVHDRRRHGLRRGGAASAGCGSTTSRRGSRSSSTATATSSRRSPSSGPSRRIWWKLMSERYRAENERSTWMRFHTQTAGVSLTPAAAAQQPDPGRDPGAGRDPRRDAVAPHRRVRRGARRARRPRPRCSRCASSRSCSRRRASRRPSIRWAARGSWRR